MPLPALIEIVPPPRPLCGQVAVPGSKSITNRALVLAALAQQRVILEGALWSDDTELMVRALQRLGYQVGVRPDAVEPANRTITVEGHGREVPPGGSCGDPLEIEVGNAGTVARFLAALLCLGSGFYRLTGSTRMHARPQAALFAALRGLGYPIESANDRLPVIIQGGGARPGACRVSIAESSQFASALLLVARAGGWQVQIEGENSEESPYIVMTSRLLEAFPHQGGVFAVEPDASSGSYFWAAGQIEQDWQREESTTGTSATTLQMALHPTVTVARWPQSGWQIDQHFPEWLARMHFSSAGFVRQLGLDTVILSRVKAEAERSDAPWLVISRQRDLADSIMTAIVLAPMLTQAVRFTDLGRLRVQECERVQALRTELTRCGARVSENGDTLEVRPSGLRGADIETYEDHRIAMCFAILGLKVPGLRLKNPACVRKTFPNFFQKLAAPPPEGLGVTLRDGNHGQLLRPEDWLPA